MLAKLRPIHHHPKVCASAAHPGRLKRRIVSGDISRTLTNRTGHISMVLRTSRSLRIVSSKHKVPISVRPRRNMPTIRLVLYHLRTNNGFSGGGCRFSNNLRNIKVSIIGTLSGHMRIGIHHSNRICGVTFRGNRGIRSLRIINAYNGHGANADIRF